MFRLAAVLPLLCPLAAFAHGMGVDAKVKEGVVRVEVYYDDSSPTRGADVKVYDANKVVVLEGVTDDTGAWTFPAPAPGEYSVRAKTDDGHAATDKFIIVSPGEPPPPPEVPGIEMRGPNRWIAALIGVLLIGAGFTGIYFVIRRYERNKRNRIESH